MRIYYQRHCANLVSWGNSNEKEYLNGKTALGQILPLDRWMGVLVISMPSTVCLSKGLTFIWQRCGWPGCVTGRSGEGSHDLLKMSSQISECMCAERKSSLCFLSLSLPPLKNSAQRKKLLCKWKYNCHIALCKRNNSTFDHRWNFLRCGFCCKPNFS